MSLNDFFAANTGGVYLRPVGIPDCFTLPAGLPHGCKPPPPPPPQPPLAMQHPCGPGPQKSRTMATVSPLHQVVPPQPNISPYEAAGGLNAFGPSQRTSSFAAALRKLAKQAGDPIIGEKDLAQISPVSSPALAQRSLTPKRNGHTGGPTQAMYLTSSGHQVNNTSFPSSSPPVVTIAPSRQHTTHTTDTRKLQVMDLGGMSPSSGAGGGVVANGHQLDSLSLKLESGKQVGRNASGEKWDDHANKSLPSSSVSSQSRPHATIAPLPRPDDSLTSSRGFQPYRSADDIRTTLPHHLSPFEHHPPAAYPYTPAFLPPPHLPHPAYRLDDALFLDRYGLLRSPVMQFPGQPGIMGSPAAFYPQSRYDLLAQSLSLSSANNSILHHERLKLEEERRQREKELELDQSRKREQERREKEQKEKEHKEREKEHKEREHKEHKEKDKERREKAHRDKGEHSESRSTNHSNSHSKRAEYAARNEAAAHSAAVNNTSPPVVSSAPLNLVVHPSGAINPVTTEHHKAQTELWLPWQQNHSSNQHNAKDSNSHEEALPPQYKIPVSLPQENNRAQPPKENPHAPSMEKYHAPYNLHYLQEKRHSSQESTPNDVDTKKTHHGSHSSSRKLDSIHHHITELSKKDSNEWKHEKLQKACANNHRKSMGDVKKLKEDTHHHHHHQAAPATTATPTHNAHHRKQVNGIIKPVPSQDEGMHARLLETEKCRIEFNSLKLQTPEKFQVPNLIHSSVQMSPKDPNLQMMYMDYNHQVLSVFKQTVDTASPNKLDKEEKSKLDKEAEDLKKKGVCDADAEETSLKEFLVLKKGLPLSLDTNPMKMRYLKLLGLTSRLKRKKIEFDIYMKRRTLVDHTSLLLDDASNSFKEVEPEKKDPLDSFAHLDALSEKLRLQTSNERTQFFLRLGMSPVSLPQKEENARVRKVLEKERTQRSQRERMKTKKKIPFSDTKKTIDVKMEGNVSKHSSQTTTVQDDQVPYAPSSQKDSTGFNRISSSSPDLCDSNQGASGKIRPKYSFKRGLSLKREWEPPTLSLTSTNNHNFPNGSLEIKTEAKCDETRAHISTATQVDFVANFGDLADRKCNKGKNFGFNWPGLDAIIEAYYRHHNEQLQEKDVLRKKCNQVRTRHEELNEEANILNKSMADLMKLKRELDEQRSQTEQSLENLKKCIQKWR